MARPPARDESHGIRLGFPFTVALRATTEWWRNAVLYQVYVRSFADSDGDGVGDLEGIRSRLGHVRELGVDGIWLTPFYPSPGIDHGYDVSDYVDVDPRFEVVVSSEREPGVTLPPDAAAWVRTGPGHG